MQQTDFSSIATTNTPRRSVLRRVFGGITWFCLWVYLLSLATIWLLIRFEGERWWVATLIMFGPRWLLGLPLVAIAPLALLQGRKSTLMLAVTALFFAVGLLHYEIPWRSMLLPKTSQPALRLLTCNTARANINIAKLTQLIADEHPDVVVLQEWTSDQAERVFPPPWHVRVDVDMLVASKDRIENVQSVLPPRGGLQGIVLAMKLVRPTGTIGLINVHLVSPHPWFDNALRGSRYAPAEITDSCQLRQVESRLTADAAHAANVPTLLAGDFNTPIDSENFRTIWPDFTDAFSVAGTGVGTTYRVKDTRTRIDHILFNRDWQCPRCHLGMDVGSPHLPVIADVELKQ
jgi:endonuclease/exonuclease/phosphatase (EEP) superfamily protein YafD